MLNFSDADSGRGEGGEGELWCASELAPIDPGAETVLRCDHGVMYSSSLFAE